MPVYEYACKGCGHEFEREQRISDPPLKKCPSCGALKARRQISRTSFVLKGGGWYSDLYGAAKPAKPAAEEKAPVEAQTSKPASDAAATKSAPPSQSDGGSPGDSPDKPPKKGGKGTKAAA